MVKLKIKLKDIVKIQRLEMEIFEEEDRDCPNNRIIRNKEGSIFKTLNKITMNWDEREKIMDCIYKNILNTKDLADELKVLGYEVIE